ncbi:MAG TPA: hypothetical protein PKN99_04015 [Cyclobacteriaceae bacterium]|jgi:hypothetical protein|nr:hypothetical protein [Cyclobacteriaceae bacterium]HNP06762.1 hypothetical protein [Cyclobacteriaceae bacterium]HRK53090.1 hypothetical protein [Cyclobacteriaceae bacterium]
MSTQFFGSMSNQGYASLWHKYRPAILQLMLAAEEGPQEYKFFKHEFKALNPKEKAYAFTLEAHQGKAVNNIKGSGVAKDLLSVLSESPKASELMDGYIYEFSMDKQFILHISRHETEVEQESDSGDENTSEDAAE